jgi:hypothetical protein
MVTSSEEYYPTVAINALVSGWLAGRKEGAMLMGCGWKLTAQWCHNHVAYMGYAWTHAFLC